MQRRPRSFIKNGKERKNIAFFWKERMPNPGGRLTVAGAVLSSPLYVLYSTNIVYCTVRYMYEYIV